MSIQEIEEPLKAPVVGTYTCKGPDSLTFGAKLASLSWELQGCQNLIKSVPDPKIWAPKNFFVPCIGEWSRYPGVSVIFLILPIAKQCSVFSIMTRQWVAAHVHSILKRLIGVFLESIHSVRFFLASSSNCILVDERRISPKLWGVYQWELATWLCFAFTDVNKDLDVWIYSWS
jgi:hypothetical protein